MSKNSDKRKPIFKAYSLNLNEYLLAIERQMVDSITGIPADAHGNLYLCPLCYCPFLFQQIDHTDSGNFLTLEHNPLLSMGGKASILTCKTCNNKSGAEKDALVRDLIDLESFLTEKNSREFPVKLKIDFKSITGALDKRENIYYIKPDQKSNPQAYQYVRDKISNKKSFHVNLSLSVPDWQEYSLGILKIAYLKAFELFSYRFADMGNGANIRDAMLKKMEYPAPNNGVIDINAEDDFLGIHIVKEPKELRALIITQKIIIKRNGNRIEKIFL